MPEHMFGNHQFALFPYYNQPVEQQLPGQIPLTFSTNLT